MRFRMKFNYLMSFIALSVLLASSACSKKVIPYSKIEDTPQNREIYTLVKTYHEAIESKNLSLLTPILSDSYYEDNGTVKGDDDYGLEELKTKLKNLFDSAKAIRLSLFLEELIVDEKNAELNYSYEVRYQIGYPDGDKWSVKEDSNIIKFSKISGQWKISSGI